MTEISIEQIEQNLWKINSFLKPKSNCFNLKSAHNRILQYFLVLFFSLLFLNQVSAQPGGCYSDTWQTEYCREQRNALIKKYDSEIKILGKKILRDPKNAELYYLRGKTYTALMKFGFKKVEFDGKIYFADIDVKAIADFTKAISLAPKAEYYAERGRIYYEYWNGERNSFQYFLNAKPTDEEILKALDELFLNNANFNRAESDYLTAVKLASDIAKSLHYREFVARLRTFRAGNIGNFDYVAKLVGGGKTADLALAGLDYQIEYRKDYYAFTKFSGGVYSIKAAWLEKAVIAKKFGRDAVALEALAEAEKLLEKDVSDICQIYRNRAEIYLRQKKYDLAIKDINSAVERGFGNCKYMIEFRGDIYQRKGEFDKAVEDYSSLLGNEYFYLNKEIYWKRGKLYLQKGEGEKAAADFTNAIGTSTLCEQDYQWRAKAYRLAGNEAAALEDDKRVLTVLEMQKRFTPSDYCYYHNQ